MIFPQVTVILNRDFWDSDKRDELINEYMERNYPNYHILEIGKYYARCERR